MFSVVIPYYKKRNYIERCLDSVLAQTYQNFEIVLVDDGSVDDIEKLINENYNTKVKLIQQENQGVSVARNTGISAAKYDYIAFLDADDSWSEYYLEYSAKVIKTEENIKIIGSNYTRINKEVEKEKRTLEYRIIENYFNKQIFANTLFTSSSSIIHKSFFDSNPGFNPEIRRGEDLDVWFRTIASGGKVVYIEHVLVYYSDEDTDQVTKKIFDLNDSILSLMINDYNDASQPKVLRDFATVFVRKRIYPYFFTSENHQQAKSILKKIGYGNFFSHFLYSLPVSIGRQLLKSSLIGYYSKYLIH